MAKKKRTARDFLAPPGKDIAPKDKEEACLPAQDEDEEMDQTGPGQTAIERVLRKHNPTLLAIEGVAGTYVGTGELGNDVIVVLLENERAAKNVPRQLEGYEVKTEVSGEIDAY